MSLPDTPRSTKTLVVGLGNVLLKDDGVGVQAVRELRRLLPKRIVVAEVGTAVLDALHLFEWADRVIAIDAMQAGGEPGTIYSFGLDEIAESERVSLHEVGLRAAFRFLRGPLPGVTILAVEPEDMDTGLELSPRVQAALPKLIQEAQRLTEA